MRSDELIQVGKKKRFLRRDARGRLQVVISEEKARRVGRMKKVASAKAKDDLRDRRSRERSA